MKCALGCEEGRQATPHYGISAFPPQFCGIYAGGGAKDALRVDAETDEAAAGALDVE